MYKFFISFLIIIFYIFPFYPSESGEKPFVFVQIGHSALITSVLITPDGNNIISSSLDKTIKIWDIDKQIITKTIETHTAGINQIAISPDGNYMASASKDKFIKLWPLNNKSEGIKCSEHQYSVNSVVFSPDGKYLISSAVNDTKTLIWDIASNKLFKSIDNNYAFEGIKISPDKKFFLLFGSNLRLFDLKSFELIREFIISGDYADFSPDSKNIVVAGRDLSIYDISSGKQIKVISKDSTIKAIYSKDGKEIFSIDYQNFIKIWNVEKLNIIAKLEGHKEQVTDIFLSKDGNKLVSSSEDYSIRLWDIKKYKELKIFKGNAFSINKSLISSDGSFAVTGGFDNILRLWDFKNAALKYNKKVDNPEDISSVSISPDLKYILSITRDMILYDRETGNEIQKFSGDRYYYDEAVTFTKDNQYILISDRSNVIFLLDIKSGRIIRKFSGHTGSIKTISLSPDGKYFVSCGLDQSVRLWSITSSSEICSSFEHPDYVTSVVFSRDGKYIVSGSMDGTLILWEIVYDIGFLRPVKKIKTHPISTLSFFPDGNKVAIGSYDKTISILDMETEKEVYNLISHASTIRSISISQNNKYLISSANDSTTKVWNLETGKEIAMLIGFVDGEWVIITPEGYFNASSKGAKYLTVKIKNDFYSMDNYTEKFYRPDLVKISLVGISLKDFSKLDDIKTAPEVKIEKADIINEEAIINLKVTDNGGGIGDVRIYLNDSAIILEDNKSKNLKSSGSISKNYKFKLNNGENTIKVIAFNSDNSMQSNEVIKTLNFKKTNIKKPSLYAMIIGINEYNNSSLNLEYAVSDAKLFADAIKEISAPLFDKVEIKLLTLKKETSKEAIINSLTSFKSFEPEDLFVFYAASHGTVDNGEYFLITSNVGSTSSKKLMEEALNQNYIKEVIANIPTSKKLIILDTCSSQSLGDKLQLTILSRRGLTEDTAIKVLSRAIGVTILCAAKTDQAAFEGYNDHGLFTYVIVDGLNGKADYDKDGYIKTLELADFVDNEVPEIAEKIFGEAQYPIVSPGGQGFPIGKVK